MERELIIRLAREAGYYTDDKDVYDGDRYGICTKEINKFAALVAAHEREACAEVCDEQFQKYGCVADKCAAAIRARGEK